MEIEEPKAKKNVTNDVSNPQAQWIAHFFGHMEKRQILNLKLEIKVRICMDVRRGISKFDNRFQFEVRIEKTLKPNLTSIQKTQMNWSKGTPDTRQQSYTFVVEWYDNLILFFV